MENFVEQMGLKMDHGQRGLAGYTQSMGLQRVRRG